MRKPAVLLLAAGLLGLCSCAVAPWNHLGEEQKTELRDGSSAYQQAMLEDLHVSEAEYRQAVADAHSCVGDAGATADPIQQTGNEELSFDYGVTTDTEQAADAINAAADACFPEHVDAVGRIWVSQGTTLTD